MQSAGEEVVLAVRTERMENIESDFTITTLQSGLEQAEVVVLAIPFDAVQSVCAPFAALLKEKIVVDATNPLNENWEPLRLGEQNSAGESVQNWFPDSQVVKAFNTIFADVMAEADRANFAMPVTGFLASDFPQAKQWVASVMEVVGLSAIDTGPLRMSRYLEAMAHLNIQIAVGQQGGTKAAFLYQQLPQ